MKQMFWLITSLVWVWMACGTPAAENSEESPIQAERNPMDAIAPADILPVSWEDLTDVSFENKYYEGVQEWMLFPNFGDSVQSLAGKPVSISGYVLTLEPGVYALSANPFSSCFFCGGAGPESVLLLELTDKEEIYFTDEWRSFAGIFQLNDSDIDKLNYILTYAHPTD